ncbi:MAG: hypothetical protein AB7U18_06745 [Dehalococcoidia bacterium]
MSRKARCHGCDHRRGPRTTAPITKHGTGRREGGSGGVARPSKRACSCNCHEKNEGER